ncbi:aldo/keto reductase [Saliphagus sp. GCM10025334]
MEYTTLGSTGLEVSKLCLGCYGLSTSGDVEWMKGREESLSFIERAVELGFNFFDTANIYAGGESEEVLGKGVAEYLDRDEAVVATKINPMISTGEGPNVAGSYSRKAIQHEVTACLDRLDMDSIDLFQLNYLDHNVPYEQTLQALNREVERGTIKHFGVGTSWTYEFAEMLYKSRLLDVHQPQTMQNHYNVVYREEERDKLPLCANEDIAVMPYSSLARGYLTRPHKEAISTARSRGEELFKKRMEIYQSNGGKEINARVQELAEDREVSMAQIALSWVLHKDCVTAPVVGVSRIEHLEDAVEALNISLSSTDLEYLEEPYQPKQMMGANEVAYSQFKWNQGFARDDHDPIAIGGLE